MKLIVSIFFLLVVSSVTLGQNVINSPPICPKKELFTVGDVTGYSSTICQANCNHNPSILILFYNSSDKPAANNLGCKTGTLCDKCKTDKEPIGAGGDGGPIELSDFDGSISHGPDVNLRIVDLLFVKTGSDANEEFFVCFSFSARVFQGFRPYLNSRVALKIPEVPEGQTAIDGRRLSDPDGFDIIKVDGKLFGLAESKIYNDGSTNEMSAFPLPILGDGM